MPAPSSPPPGRLRHLLIAGAKACAEPPPLPHMQRLLAQLQRVQPLQVPDDSPATAHELTAAAAWGLPGAPQGIPWAAFESGTVGSPCAWLRPVHLELGLDQIQLIAPEALQLSDAHSRALLAACAPLLAEDGIHTTHHASGQWLAQGALLAGVQSPSPQRAAGRRLTRAELLHCADPAEQRQLTRLLSELEMLLATHPVNTEREAAGQWPVNALWIHGAGTLPAPLPPAPDVLIAQELAEAPPEPAAQAAAWQTIDTQYLPALLASLAAGEPVRLSLTGHERALTLHAAPGGWWQRMRNTFKRQRLSDLIQQL